MNERLKFEGRLAEKQREVKALRLKLEGLVETIRDRLDPFCKVDDLDGLDIAASQAVDLSAGHIRLQALLGEIRAIEKALGV